MNPVKFRVWMSGRMLPVTRVDWLPDGKLGQVVGLEANEDMTDYGFWLTDPAKEDFVLMQFTGVVDKRGREIYDGDILRHDDGSLSVVGWDNMSNAWVYVGEDVLPYTVYGGVMRGSEVIGNRYQNGELITWGDWLVQ